MIDREMGTMSVVQQCRLLALNRSTYYFQGRGESAANLALMRVIDEQFLATPTYGSREMRHHLRHLGYRIGRQRVRRLMRKMGLHALYQVPRTSLAHPEHTIYPYLLRDLAITRPNQVWSADITYIPMRHGFLYLVAVMDWYSRKVLSWRLSNTMDSSFCVEALKAALEKHGKPEIFNTDQGSQFTDTDFTGVLKATDVKISMDGKGRWMDNVMIERLWRSLKYECVYLNAFDDGVTARTGIGGWIEHYNTRRPHSAHAGQTPDEAYSGSGMTIWAA